MMERVLSAITANFATKVISLIISVVLWFIVLGSRNVEVTKEIPLEVITPADIVPSNEIPERIAFRLSGPKAFLRAVIDRHEEPIRVNLASAKPGLVTYRFFSDNIRVPIGVKVLSINPTAILIKLEYLKRREVPVHAELRGAAPEGFRVARVEVHPDTVRIKGAETKVDAVTEVVTAPIDVSGLHQSVEKEATLDLARLGVQLDSPIPKVLVDLEPISANYRIKNVDIRVVSPYKVRMDEKTVTVLVRADPKELKSLDRNQVYATVDLTGKPKGKYSEPIKVSLPEGVGLVKVVPDHANITLY